MIMVGSSDRADCLTPVEEVQDFPGPRHIEAVYLWE